MSQAWFAPKRFGYGSKPSTWQGWTATPIYVALVMAAPRLTMHVLGRTPVAKETTFGLIALLTIGFLILVWKKRTPRAE